MDVIKISMSELFSFDKRGLYRIAIGNMSSGIEKLSHLKPTKKAIIDEEIKEAAKIYCNAILTVDSLLKQSNFNKDSNFISKIVLKTLKMAQTMLASLLLKNPIKIGIAYNAMHNVIKFFEKELLKNTKPIQVKPKK